MVETLVAPAQEARLPPLLLIGPQAESQTLRQFFSRTTRLNRVETLIRGTIPDALPLLRERPEIAAILILGENIPECSLRSGLQALQLAPGQAFRSFAVHLPVLPSNRLADWFWQQGIRLLSGTIATQLPSFAETLAAALRECAQQRSLAAAATAPGLLSEAKTLRELAGYSLQTLHEQGIGTRGGLFCLQGQNPTQRTLVLGATGRFGCAGVLPLEALDAPAAVESIQKALRNKQHHFRDHDAAYFLQSPDGVSASIFLSQNLPLTSWQRSFIDILCSAIGRAINRTQLAHQLSRTQHATITAMATLAEYRDSNTGEHVARVARAATEIAISLAERHAMPGIDEFFIDQIGQASILHDIGKIAIPENILLKPGALTPTERLVMQEHASLGSEILLRAAKHSDNGELLQKAAEIAHCHHEKFDGSGYPNGLRGEEIPLSARIVALVDVFDALTSQRPYKPAWPLDKALAHIQSEAGRHFDPILVEELSWLEIRKKSSGFILWDESMSVGHPELDADHQRLIALINRLWVARTQNHRRIVEFILDDLLHYTEVHFKREEQLMADFAYSDLDRHCACHQAFCQHLAEIRWEFHQGIHDEPGEEVLRFLTDWLNRHILEDDMAYRHALSPGIGNLALSPFPVSDRKTCSCNK